VIDEAIGNGSSARITYLDFLYDHGITRKTVTATIPVLRDLGLIRNRNRAAAKQGVFALKSFDARSRCAGGSDLWTAYYRGQVRQHSSS
jgi:hypothetical protein